MREWDVFAEREVLEIPFALCAQERPRAFIKHRMHCELDAEALKFTLGALGCFAQQTGGVLELLADPRRDNGEPVVEGLVQRL
jgi:hypothetical protein